TCSLRTAVVGRLCARPGRSGVYIVDRNRNLPFPSTVPALRDGWNGGALLRSHCHYLASDEGTVAPHAIRREDHPIQEGFGMFESARVNELEARKRLLVAESELNRRLLMIEIERLKPAARQAREIASIGKTFSPVFATAAAVVTGALLARGKALKSVAAK